MSAFGFDSFRGSISVGSGKRSIRNEVSCLSGGNSFPAGCVLCFCSRHHQSDSFVARLTGQCSAYEPAVYTERTIDAGSRIYTWRAFHARSSLDARYFICAWGAFDAGDAGSWFVSCELKSSHPQITAKNAS